MISKDDFDDLKQFIATTASQTEARLTDEIDRLDQKLTDKIEKLEQKVDDGFAGVGEAFETIHDHVGKTDQRLTKLEKLAA